MKGCGLKPGPTRKRGSTLGFNPTDDGGLYTQFCPESCPTKELIRAGPRKRERPGSSKGDALSICNMVMGWALSLRSNAPLSPGPSHRFCRPNEILTLLKVSPTEPSIRRNRLMVGEPSGSGVTRPSSRAVACKTLRGFDATLGAC